MLTQKQTKSNLKSSQIVIEFNSLTDNNFEIFVSSAKPTEVFKGHRDFLKNKAILFPQGVDLYAKVYDVEGNSRTLNLSELNDTQLNPVQLHQVEISDTQISPNNFMSFNCDDERVTTWIHNQCFSPKLLNKPSMVASLILRCNKILSILLSPQRILTTLFNLCGLTKNICSNFWNLTKSVGDVRKFLAEQVSVKTLQQDDDCLDELNKEAMLQEINSRINKDGFITRPNLLTKLPRELKRYMELISLDLYKLQKRIKNTYDNLSDKQKIQLYRTLQDAKGEKVGGDYGAKATPSAKRTDYEAAYSRFQELLRNRFLSVVLTSLSIPISIWKLITIFSSPEKEEESSTAMQQIDLIVNVVLATMPLITSVLTSNAHQALKAHAEEMRQSWNQFYQNIDTKLKPFERRATAIGYVKARTQVAPMQQNRLSVNLPFLPHSQSRVNLLT